MRQTLMVAVLVLLLVCCGGEADTGTTAATAGTVAVTVTTTSDPPTTTAPVPSTTLVTELTVRTAGSPATELTEGLRYHAADAPFTMRAGAIDVISPASGDAYPTVVVFHGDPRFANKEWHRSDAQLLAEQGRVVLLPAWGHGDSTAINEMGMRAWWDLIVREVRCAVLFAETHTQEYGGDPDHITLYGLSAGGNAVLMAGLTDAEPLDNCSVQGPAVEPQALVPIDADWTLGGDWDRQISEDPELFYLMTPWRYLDGSQDIPIHVTVAENPGSYTRSVEPNPATSWLSYRHHDIDLVGDLDKRGYLADGSFSLKESGEYAAEILREAGYDVTLVVLPGASHMSWGDDGLAVVIDTVLHAEPV